MPVNPPMASPAPVTRQRLAALVAGAAAAAGGVALRGGGGPPAAPAAASRQTDREILAFFLQLEQVQEAFYRQAEASRSLSAPRREMAATLRSHEAEHVSFLRRRLGRDPRPPRSDFGDAFSTDRRFLDAAVVLEEAAIAGYVGQAPHLTARLVVPIATIVSVEARQAAWVRDLAGVSPAPRAADPAEEPDTILQDLSRRGYLR